MFKDRNLWIYSKKCICIFWRFWKIKTERQSFVFMTGVLQPRKTCFLLLYHLWMLWFFCCFVLYSFFLIYSREEYKFHTWILCCEFGPWGKKRKEKEGQVLLVCLEFIVLDECFFLFYICFCVFFNNEDKQRESKTSDLPGISFRKRNGQAKPCQR